MKGKILLMQLSSFLDLRLTCRLCLETTAADISSIAGAYRVNGKQLIHNTRILSVHTGSWSMPRRLQRHSCGP